DGPAVDDGHVIARLFGERTTAGEPRADPARTGIVASRGESEIAELRLQIMQITRRIFQRLDRIERIGKPAPIRRLRHELRDALRTLGAHGLRAGAGVPPAHPGRE